MSSSISSKIHEVAVGNLTFSSDFDSGNTCAVDYDAASNTYNLWMAHDCDGTQYESHFKAWFYFGVRGFTADQKVAFAINNMGKQRQLFNVHKLRPVTRAIPDDPQWKRIEGRTLLLRQGSKKDRNYELRWSYKYKYSPEATVYFAMCYPFGYDDLQLYLEQLESICRDDPRAAALRSHYDLKFVPMINPDGVHMGNYRTNSRGINLNRFYSNAGPDHEAVTAIVELAQGYAQRDLLHLYVDLHAHANKTGCFLFGNALNSPLHHAWNTAFARVMAINSPYFDLNKCNFSAKNMSKRDKRISRESSRGAALGNLTGDGEQSNEVAHSENNEDDEGGNDAASVSSKEGCGRVAIHKLTGITHSYTLECSYARPTHVDCTANIPGSSKMT
ncbi:Cytosolic carboxypeptidase-like protein 5 [Perkinsus olseni]|uniref:Cytosolic carboxypeptidase-like protein 5 n=1 Tax=Perkinsus olseni TaxID=32597 RepID=A0A7J6L7N2_PEROL|nr:Cytosolic carboxypeptidase-like protein 5 [Perkinsus olseni]